MKKISSILTLIAITHLTTVTHAAPRAEKIIDSLNNPLFLTAPAGSTDALYILEKPGRVMIYDRASKKINPEPFLDIRDQIDIKMNEQGLLGMAFSPDYKIDRRFYLYYTDLKGDTQVSRFTVKANGKDIDEEKLLSVKQDFRNHNGGWIGFGPDNFLYIALGDGGAGNDPKNRAQDMTQLLGKILRIDVSAKKGYTIPKDNPYVAKDETPDEIYAYGLRNPWRCSWDTETNLFYFGDVGQNNWEEVNVVDQKTLTGANFGWRLREATHATPANSVGGEKPKAAIDPVLEYDRSQGKSITGGYVYRGKIKSIEGHYFYADYVSNKIWSFKFDGKKVSDKKECTKMFAQRGRPINQIASFGLDPQGEMYIIGHQGDIYKIVE
jgi:glucose/arabinose dehydrogenase